MSALIEFIKDEKEMILNRLKSYMDQQFELELGTFDAEFLLEFLSENLGVFYYNRGLHDAQALMSIRLADLTEVVYELEKTTPKMPVRSNE